MILYKFLNKRYQAELNAEINSLSQPQIQQLRGICSKMTRAEFIKWFFLHVPEVEEYIVGKKRKRSVILNRLSHDEKLLLVFSVLQYRALADSLLEAISECNLLEAKDPSTLLQRAGRVQMAASFLNDKIPLWPFGSRSPFCK